MLGCVKGSRECTYPEPRPKTRPRSSKADAAQPATTIAEESSREEETAKNPRKAGSTEVLKDGGKGKKPDIGSRKKARGKGAACRKQDVQGHKQPIPSIEQTRQDLGIRESPETDGSGPLSASQAGSRNGRHLDILTSESSMSPGTNSLSHLPQHERMYLEYLREHITYHHYFFRNDANDFIHNILIEHALSYEPLLNAVVGFAAFHATLAKKEGKIQDFLGYYNKAVSLLLKSLIGGQRHTEAMLLTILQLATFEVLYLNLFVAVPWVRRSYFTGVSWGLGQFDRPPESRFQYADRILFGRFDHGKRARKENPRMVCKIRPFHWLHVRL